MGKNTENIYNFLISGKAREGKSTSLRNLKDPKGVLYFCFDNGKRLPFKNTGIRVVNIHDIKKFLPVLRKGIESPNIHTIVLDTITYMMDSYEDQIVATSKNVMQGWGNYGKFWRTLQQEYLGSCGKNIINIGHTDVIYGADENITAIAVKVKGAIMSKGIESAYNTVVSTKVVRVKDLLKKDSDGNLIYDTPLLKITPAEKSAGFKYVFQTQITENTLLEKISAPIGMWDIKETFIDNDAQHVIDKIGEYYA